MYIRNTEGEWVHYHSSRVPHAEVISRRRIREKKNHYPLMNKRSNLQKKKEEVRTNPKDIDEELLYIMLLYIRFFLNGNV